MSSAIRFGGIEGAYGPEIPQVVPSRPVIYDEEVEVAGTVFHFRAEGRDDVHTFVGVFAGPTAGTKGKAGVLCLGHEEWEEFREHVLGRADPLRVQATELVPWPGE